MYIMKLNLKRGYEFEMWGIWETLREKQKGRNVESIILKNLKYKKILKKMEIQMDSIRIL